MKSLKHQKNTEIQGQKSHTTPFVVRSPFLHKQPADFVYVERRKPKPKLGEPRSESKPYYGAGKEYLETNNT